MSRGSLPEGLAPTWGRSGNRFRQLLSTVKDLELTTWAFAPEPAAIPLAGERAHCQASSGRGAAVPLGGLSRCCCALHTPEQQAQHPLLLPHRLPKPWQVQQAAGGVLALPGLAWGAAPTWPKEEKTLGGTAAPRTCEGFSKEMEPEPAHSGTRWENEVLWARGDIRTGNEEKWARAQVAQGGYAISSLKGFQDLTRKSPE